jgi:hypothetical protein
VRTSGSSQHSGFSSQRESGRASSDRLSAICFQPQRRKSACGDQRSATVTTVLSSQPRRRRSQMLPKTPQVRWVLVLVCVPAAVPPQAQPVGTAFTYQGRLNDGGAPPPAASTSSSALRRAQRQDPDRLDGLGDSGGRGHRPVTVSLDFGPAFGPEAHWLEIAVRPAVAAYSHRSASQLTPAPGGSFVRHPGRA